MLFIFSALLLLPLLRIASAVPLHVFETRADPVANPNETTNTTVGGLDPDVGAIRMLSATLQMIQNLITAGLNQTSPNDADAGIPLLQSIANQTIFETVKNTTDFQCIIPLTDLNDPTGTLNPTLPRTAAFVHHYATTMVMGNTALLDNSSIILSNFTQKLLQQAVEAGRSMVNATAAYVYPNTTISVFPEFTVNEYIASIVPQYIPCSNSQGQSLPLPSSHILDYPIFASAFSLEPNEVLTVGASGLCPANVTCFCQNFVVNSEETTPTLVTPLSNCSIADELGHGMFFITNGSTPLSPKALVRAQQAGILGAVEVIVTLEQL